MFKKFDRVFSQRQADADVESGKPCQAEGPNGGWACTLNPLHEGTHLAGITKFGMVVAEWDDDRSTDDQETMGSNGGVG